MTANGIAVNAVLFSLLHAINIIGGYPPPALDAHMIGGYIHTFT